VVCDTLRIKRVRSDFVGRKLDLIRGRLVAVLAAQSMDSSPSIPL